MLCDRGRGRSAGRCGARSPVSCGSADGQEGAARVRTFCWTARLAGESRSERPRKSLGRNPGDPGAFVAGTLVCGPGLAMERSVAGSLPPFSRALAALAGGSPHLPLLGGLGWAEGEVSSAQGAPLTVWLKTKRQARASAGEAAKQCPGHRGRGGCFGGTVEWAVSQPQLSDPCVVPGAPGGLQGRHRRRWAGP